MFLRMNKALNDRRAGLEREKGFTLIELLVVVIIIGILAAIAIPVYLGIQDNAKDSAAKADVINIKTAALAIQADTNAMPAALTDITYTPSDGTVNPAYTYVAATGALCISVESASGKIFRATEDSGVAEGAAC